MGRLMLSAGMVEALADPVGDLSRALPLGSPPPLRAATVISRRIFEKSFPRWTSVLPFFRLICDHRECPDMDPHPPSLMDALSAFTRASRRSRRPPAPSHPPRAPSAA